MNPQADFSRVTLSRQRNEAKWAGGSLDRVRWRFRSLLLPAVSIAAILSASVASDPAAAILQLYSWERDRLLTLAKGAGGAAITVLAGFISATVTGHVVINSIPFASAAVLVVGLLVWGGFLLVGLRRLAEEYTAALEFASAR